MSVKVSGMKQQIIDTLNDLAIAHRIVKHAPVFTVEESSRAMEDKTPVKNLVLKDNHSDQFYMVVMRGELRLDMKWLAQNLAIKKLSFAKADVLKELLDVTPGAVSIFGLINDQDNVIKLVIDDSLICEKDIGFHPNDNTETIFIPGKSVAALAKKLGNDFLLLDFG